MVRTDGGPPSAWENRVRQVITSGGNNRFGNTVMGTGGPRLSWQESLGLLILRLGLAWFLFVWAVNKILAPDQYVRIWGYFHGIEIGASAPYVMRAGIYEMRCPKPVPSIISSINKATR